MLVGQRTLSGPNGESCPRLMVWLASACGIVMCRGWGCAPIRARGAIHGAAVTIGLDPAQTFFQVHGFGPRATTPRGSARRPLPAAAKGAPGLDLEGEEQVSAPSGRHGPYQREARASGCLDRTGPRPAGQDADRKSVKLVAVALAACMAFGSCRYACGRAESLPNPIARNSRPRVWRLAEIPNASCSHATRSTKRQCTTPSRSGFGPASTVRASAAR